MATVGGVLFGSIGLSSLLQFRFKSSAVVTNTTAGSLNKEDVITPPMRKSTFFDFSILSAYISINITFRIGFNGLSNIMNSQEDTSPGYNPLNGPGDPSPGVTASKFYVISLYVKKKGMVVGRVVLTRRLFAIIKTPDFPPGVISMLSSS